MSTEQLTAAGLRPGVPARIRPETKAIDARSCRALKCGHCHKRTCRAEFWTDGRCYKVLARCSCGWTDER